MYIRYDYKRASDEIESIFIASRIGEVKQALTTANVTFTHTQFERKNLNVADQVTAAGLPAWVFEASKKVDKSNNRYGLEFRATDAILIDLPKVQILLAFNRESGNSQSVDDFPFMAYYFMMTNVKGTVTNIDGYPTSFTNYIGELNDNSRPYPAKGNSGIQAFVITDKTFMWIMRNNASTSYDVLCGFTELENGKVIPFPTIRYPDIVDGLSDKTLVGTTLRSSMNNFYDVNYGDRILNRFILFPYLIGYKNFGVLTKSTELFNTGFSGALLQLYTFGGAMYLGTGILSNTICVKC